MERTLYFSLNTWKTLLYWLHESFVDAEEQDIYLILFESLLGNLFIS